MQSLSRRRFISLLTAASMTTVPSSFARAQTNVAPSGEEFPIWSSDVNQVPYKFRRREVAFETSEPAGTIVVDSKRRYLYFITGQGRAIRYGIGIGRQGAQWQGVAVVYRMAKWPVWTPSEEMKEKLPLSRRHANGMPGGFGNPLGARAIYLLNNGVDNLLRIHGTPEPQTVGRTGTSGCFRMLNVDVADLYERVSVGTRVVVLPF